MYLFEETTFFNLKQAKCTIFDAQDKDDTRFILKQLVKEELLTKSPKNEHLFRVIDMQRYFQKIHSMKPSKEYSSYYYLIIYSPNFGYVVIAVFAFVGVCNIGSY